MHAEQASLETKNGDLLKAFREKTKAHQQTQRQYQSLKAQIMASQVANAAGDEVEYGLQTGRDDCFVDRLSGTRTGTANLSQLSGRPQVGIKRPHNRNNSRSSGSSGQQQGGIGIGPPYASHLQGRNVGSRVHTGREFSIYTPSPSHIVRCPFQYISQTNEREESALAGTPSGAHRSHLPVIGGTRHNPYLNQNIGVSYKTSPITRHPLVTGVAGHNFGNFSLGSKMSRRGVSTNIGPVER